VSKRDWDDLRLAGAFLTVFPVARNRDDKEFKAEELARSMAFFPAVGLVLGLALVVIDWVLGGLIPRPVLDCLLLLGLIIITGALHLDGIADLIDGLAGGRDRADILRIMKDSRVGAIGAVGLVMILLLKYLSLFNLPLEIKSAALLLMPAAGRWMQVVMAVNCPYIRSEGGTGGAFVDNVGERELLIASGTLVLATLILCGAKGVVFCFLVAGCAWVLMAYFRRRLGGVTGDVLGAATEITEVFALIALLALY